MPDFAWQALRRAGKLDLRRKVDLTVEGLDLVPASGPVLLAARHYHHLHDGAALMATIPRPMRILVGLDWIENTAAKRAMDRACAAAGWPVVMRRRPDAAGFSAEEARTLVAALEASVEVLRKGEVLLVFPEGYPTIDPTWTPKTRDDELLPFHPGVVRIALRAAQAGIVAPIVPVGLEYHRGPRWSLTMRFGLPRQVGNRDDGPTVLQELEEDVRRLSNLPARE
jgi:1-acyl-sn-glycerol-3-phosphate acyltransferase